MNFVLFIQISIGLQFCLVWIIGYVTNHSINVQYFHCPIVHIINTNAINTHKVNVGYALSSYEKLKTSWKI